MGASDEQFTNGAEPMIFHLLSFEGPDLYAHAGGIGSRMNGLARALAELGFETHLWFVGDPGAPGHERNGNLFLHRWCQWISRYYPIGVYHGEHAKVADYARSLPAFLLESAGLRAALVAGQRVVVMAEEWHTVPAVLALDALLRREGLRERATLLWNANNDFGFEHVDWQRLQQAATITTVSRYMRHRMWQMGVDPIALPNGIEAEAFVVPEPVAQAELAQRVRGRLLLAKVARWDPSKRWLFAIDGVHELKRLGQRPLLMARGGIETHEREVLDRCRAYGLRFNERADSAPGARGLLELLSGLDEIDVLVSRSHLDREARALLFSGADAVLANSGHEPFGLVGLEAMAVGGVACTGNTGEEYAQDGLNALVFQTNDAREFVSLLGWLHSSPGREAELRLAARAAAREYTWTSIVERALLPRLDVLAGVVAGSKRPHLLDTEARESRASGRDAPARPLSARAS